MSTNEGKKISPEEKGPVPQYLKNYRKLKAAETDPTHMEYPYVAAFLWAFTDADLQALANGSLSSADLQLPPGSSLYLDDSFIASFATAYQLAVQADQTVAGKLAAAQDAFCKIRDQLTTAVWSGDEHDLTTIQINHIAGN